MCTSRRALKFADLAFEQAQLSPCNFKHGAVISKGSKIICKAYNNPRTKYLNWINCCSHAEMAVATKFINSYLPNNKVSSRNKNKYYNLNNYIIWVVRISNPRADHLESTCVDSMPCRDCINQLLKLGFKKIGYSTQDGTIVIKYLEQINNEHLSNVQILTEKYRKNFR